jgi:hypothetical protein
LIALQPIDTPEQLVHQPDQPRLAQLFQVIRHHLLLSDNTGDEREML